MDKRSLTNFLIASQKVSPVSANEIANNFSEKEILKNTLLLRSGKIADDYFFLEEGYLRSFAHDQDGNEITTEFFCSGQVVFEVASFFNRTVSQENIEALSDCRGWCINYTQLNLLFHESQEFREFGRAILVKGFAALKLRMLSMITASAEERYIELMQNRPQLLISVPLKFIASYLGITDTSLSRIRKEYSGKK